MLRSDRSLLPDTASRAPADAADAQGNRTQGVWWAVGILLIVVTALFQAYDILRRLDIVLETEQHRFLNLVRSLGEQTANTLQTVDALLREAGEDAVNSGPAADEGALDARLRARIAGLPQLVSLTIEAPDALGAPLTSAAVQSLPSARHDGASGGDPARGLYIYDSIQRGAGEHGMITFARRVLDRRGKPVGVAVAELSVDYFQRLYAGIDLGPGSAVTLFRTGGGVIAHFPTDRSAQDVAAEAGVLERLLTAPGRAAVALLPNPADGQDRIYAVQAVPGAALAIGASVAKSAVLAPWYVQAMHSTVRTTLLCLSVALLIWLVLRQLRRRERAERRLLVQTALLDELFESAPEAIVMLDMQQRVTRANREFTAMFGYSAQESQGHRLAELIVPDDLRGHENQAGVSAEHSATETERIRKDGSRLHVSMLAAPILTDQGQIASYAIFRDITERRLAEAERAKLESRLRQAERLEAIGTMAGGIAHDFGSVLTAILSYGDMAFQAAAPGDPVRRHIERVMSAAHRAKALINQILTYSRSTHGKRYVMRICEAIDEVLPLVRASLPANVRLRVRLEAREARVMADATQVHQLLLNLSSNAVQAMPDGGVLEVSVDTIDTSADTKLSHGLLPAGRYVRLRVTDTGCGMDADTLSHVFEPFFTTKEPGSGTGLGLALVDGIVTELGGAAHVTSKLAAGSGFDLYLPRAEAGDDAASASTTALLPRGHGQRVLLVEDEKPLMLLAEEMLAALNFEPAGFTQASAALAEFRADPSRFDLVIVDHLLPEGTGIAFARELRRARADVTIILLSGYSGPLLMQEAVSAGIQRILTKPLELEALAAVIAELLPATPAR